MKNHPRLRYLLMVVLTLAMPSVDDALAQAPDDADQTDVAVRLKKLNADFKQENGKIVYVNFRLTQSKGEEKPIELGGENPMKGSPVMLDVDNAPVEEVLEEIEKQTGNKIRVTGPNVGEIMERRISLSVNAVPFWKVVGLLEEKSGARFYELEDGMLYLHPDGPTFDKIAFVKKPVVKGAFRLKPGVKESFGWFKVAIETEPKYGLPTLVKHRYVVETKDGKRFACETKRDMHGFDVHTKRLTPTVDLDDLEPLDGKRDRDSFGVKSLFPESLTEAAKLEFRAELKIPLKWEHVTLPPVRELVAKTKKLEEASVRIPIVEMVKADDGSEECRVAVTVDGLPVDGGECYLVDAKGKRHDPHAAGTLTPPDKPEQPKISLRFKRGEIQGPFNQADLILRNEAGDREWRIDDFAELAAAPQKAGEMTVWVTEADIDDDGSLDVKLHANGIRLFMDRARLIADGKSIKPQGHAGVGGNYSLSFAGEQLPEDPLDARLQLYVPVKTESIRLEHAWKDVKIRKKED